MCSSDLEFFAILIFDVLEHAQNPSALIKEAFRVLKPSGRMFVYVPCENDRLSWVRLLGLFGLTEKYAGHINHFSRKEIFAMLKNAGFKIQKTRGSEHFFGQLAGLISFVLMERAGKKSAGQVNNESYFSFWRARFGFLARILSAIIYTLVFIESTLLARVPSPNAQIFVQKD